MEIGSPAQLPLGELSSDVVAGNKQLDDLRVNLSLSHVGRGKRQIQSDFQLEKDQRLEREKEQPLPVCNPWITLRA